jgi:subtilisin family serine protease
MQAWDKLDPALASTYADYLQQAGEGQRAEPAALNVSLHYVGDLAPIEALGFRTTWRISDDHAMGAIDLANLAAIAAHPNVWTLAAGEAHKPMLDISVPDVHADQVWTRTGSTFTGPTGKGVIVAIIDSGIDFSHPYFQTIDSAPPTTRILSIWDQGLVPITGNANANLNEKCPTLSSTHKYGVEYDSKAINDSLQGVTGNNPKVRHRDCLGHGTHVASIAAGNGQDKTLYQNTQNEFKYVGVAPMADLIIVKIFGLEQDPILDVATKDKMEWLTRFMDAITYVLDKAAALNKPVVINCSLGNAMGPHDGFADEDDFVTKKLAGTKGKILVAAAGNAANVTLKPTARDPIYPNHHSLIEFPAGANATDLLFMLATNEIHSEYSTCQWKDDTGTAFIDVYYPQSAAVTLTFTITFPDNTTATAPALNIEAPAGAYKGRKYQFLHKEHKLPSSAAASGRRNLFRFGIAPNEATKLHALGKYKLTIASTGAVNAHLWSSQGSSRFWISPAQATFVTTEDTCEISTPAGAPGVITVAAYDAHDRNVARFSSRGPIVSYGGPIIQAKPDLAAPGVDVKAARSTFMETILYGPAGPRPYTSSGTSMATPHVSGTVALMLEKNKDLTFAQVLAALQHAQKGWAGGPDDTGAGHLDVFEAIKNSP